LEDWHNLYNQTNIREVRDLNFGPMAEINKKIHQTKLDIDEKIETAKDVVRAKLGFN